MCAHGVPIKFHTGQWLEMNIVPYGLQLRIAKIVHFKFQNKSFDLNVIGSQSEDSFSTTVSYKQLRPKTILKIENKKLENYEFKKTKLE